MVIFSESSQLDELLKIWINIKYHSRIIQLCSFLLSIPSNFWEWWHTCIPSEQEGGGRGRADTCEFCLIFSLSYKENIRKHNWRVNVYLSSWFYSVQKLLSTLESNLSLQRVIYIHFYCRETWKSWTKYTLNVFQNEYRLSK